MARLSPAVGLLAASELKKGSSKRGHIKKKKGASACLVHFDSDVERTRVGLLWCPSWRCGGGHLRSAQADWLGQAKACLEVPAEVLNSKTEFTHDPAALCRWRDTLAAVVAKAL